MTGPPPKRPPPKIATFDLTLLGTSTRTTAVIRVAGELDLRSVPELGATATTALTLQPQVHRLIVDLSRVTFLGSAALAALLSVSATADKRHAVLLVVAPTDHWPVARPWAAVGMHRVLPLYTSQDAALRA